MTSGIQSKTISQFLERELLGSDITIEGVCSLDVIKPKCLMFVEYSTPEVWSKVNDLQENLIICHEQLAMSINGPRIISENPRLSFIFAVREFFVPTKKVEIDPTAKIEPGASIGKNVSIGPFSVIGKEVSIGDNTVIGDNVIIKGRTTIGKHCFFKSNSVIGEDGFGFCLDENGTPHASPHFGGINIGNYVWMGANSTIERGMFDDTTIEDHVKIDDLVQIGHNTTVGHGSRLAAGTIICGSVKIEPQCWVGPNSNILERKVIGRDSLIGLGTNILTDVPENSVFVGNPGRKIRDNIENTGAAK